MMNLLVLLTGVLASTPSFAMGVHKPLPKPPTPGQAIQFECTGLGFNFWDHPVNVGFGGHPMTEPGKRKFRFGLSVAQDRGEIAGEARVEFGTFLSNNRTFTVTGTASTPGATVLVLNGVDPTRNDCTLDGTVSIEPNGTTWVKFQIASDPYKTQRCQTDFNDGTTTDCKVVQ